MNATESTNHNLAQSAPREEWSGAWIWPENVDADRNVYGLFRRTFECRTAATLTLHITANNFYTLHVDSKFICRGPIRAHLRYYSFDSVTLSLEPGVHAIAVMVHHVGELVATMEIGRPGLLADVQLDIDGSTVDLSTGGDWNCCRCDAWTQDLPCLMSHFGFWEDVDFRRYPHGWMDAGFHDGDWQKPFVIGSPPCEPWACLLHREIPRFDYIERKGLVAGFGQWTHAALMPIIPLHQRRNAHEFEKPDDTPHLPSEEVSLRTRRPARLLSRAEFPLLLVPPTDNQGHYLTLDFGTSLSGFVIIRLGDTHAGQRIDVAYGEILDASGSLNPEQSYVHNADRYTLSGVEREIKTTHPRGFRYVMIDVETKGHELIIEEVHVLEEAYPYTDQKAFSSSDPALNELFEKCGRTIRGCTIDCFVDNAVRERVHWTGEAMFCCQLAAPLLFGDTAMSRRSLIQSAQGILPDGRINGFTPRGRTGCTDSIRTILWLEHLVDYWLFTGDRADIEALLPVAKRVIGALINYGNEHGLIDNWPKGEYWDWSHNDRGGPGACLLLTNAFHVHALQRLAEQEVFAEALPGLAERAAAIRNHCHETYWDPDQAVYRDCIQADGTPSHICSQFANSAAVLAGICPAEHKGDLLQRITDAALIDPLGVGEAKKGPVKAIVPASTPWSAYWLCRAFFESGLDIEAVEHMKSNFCEFDRMATLPEVRIQHGNTCLCQSVGAAATHLLCGHVLGIEPMAGGWSEVRFAPQPARLTSAGGEFMTPLGRLAARWERIDGTYELHIEKPEGMSVHVRFGAIDEMVDKGSSWRGSEKGTTR